MSQTRTTPNDMSQTTPDMSQTQTTPNDVSQTTPNMSQIQTRTAPGMSRTQTNHSKYVLNSDYSRRYCLKRKLKLLQIILSQTQTRTTPDDIVSKLSNSDYSKYVSNADYSKYVLNADYSRLSSLKRRLGLLETILPQNLGPLQDDVLCVPNLRIIDDGDGADG
jgi:hypothetical protein